MKYICVEVPETSVILIQIDDEKRSHVLSLSEAESLANTLLKMVTNLTMRASDGVYWACKKCDEPNNHVSYKFCVSCGSPRR